MNDSLKRSRDKVAEKLLIVDAKQTASKLIKQCVLMTNYLVTRNVQTFNVRFMFVDDEHVVYREYHSRTTIKIVSFENVSYHTNMHGEIVTHENEMTIADLERAHKALKHHTIDEIKKEIIERLVNERYEEVIQCKQS